ncbi:MAG: transposase [Melioribacteraceae bacterium]|nr:transposase [Melioribacteraceae bacterium]
MGDKLYYADTFHHIYNRGTLRTNIFFVDEDYNYFLNRLQKFKDKYEIRVITYCLLNNHFHLFVRQTNDKLTIGKFISDLQNAHTKFINKKYKRTGVLFEGPAKIKFISEKEYHKYIVEYILLNPVKANLVKNAAKWKYSTAFELLNMNSLMISDESELIRIYGTIDTLKSLISNFSSSYYLNDIQINLEG